VQDCSAAAQNILIAATDKGLGSVWCGAFPREDRVSSLRKLLRLPDNVVPLALIPIGYPAEEKPPSERFDPARIHHDRW
jgi:nitroreductase